MNIRRKARRAALAALASVLVLPILGSPAAADGSTCTFQSGTVDIVISDDPPNTLQTFVVLRDSGGSIRVGTAGRPLGLCQGATTSNTNLVRIAGSPGNEELLISQQSGRFAPGATSESPFLSEIEFSVALGGGFDKMEIGGTPQADTIVFGAGTTGTSASGSVALNADFDADLDFSGVEFPLVTSGDGADQLSARGGNGTGGAFPTTMGFQGGIGGDTLLGGPGPDDLHGEAGRDTIEGSGNDDDIFGGEDGDRMIGGPGLDEIFGGPFEPDPDAEQYIPGPGDDVIEGVQGSGNDLIDFSPAAGPVNVNLQAGTASGEGADRFTEIEHVTGSAFGDTLNGSDTGNVISGGQGDDFLAGAQDSDRLFPGVDRDDVRGGAGIDEVSYSNMPTGMEVDLAAGFATIAGDGSPSQTDTIANTVEDVTGTPSNDVLRGSDVANVLRGGDLDDDLFGLAGDDRLEGGNGNDDLDGGANTDSCVQGNGTGTLTDCENVGTFELKPRRAEVGVGERLDYLLTWTHPNRWRRLDTVELRVRNGDRVLVWVRWNQEGNTFQLAKDGGFGPERPGGSGATLASPLALLHLEGSDAAAFDPRTIAVAIRLSFRRGAIGEHVVEVTAEDDRGNRMAWERAGTLKVRA